MISKVEIRTLKRLQTALSVLPVNHSIQHGNFIEQVDRFLWTGDPGCSTSCSRFEVVGTCRKKLIPHVQCFSAVNALEKLLAGANSKALVTDVAEDVIPAIEYAEWKSPPNRGNFL